MLKRAKVVMLPTNEKAKPKDIIICNKDYEIKNLFAIKGEMSVKLQSGCVDENYWDGQYLYITSDDEIKEGDWCINPKGYPEIFGYDFRAVYSREEILSCKKIIATTDSSLKINATSSGRYVKSLPQPSQSFIEKYVEGYNKGNVITDVLVEYEDISLLPFNDDRLSIWRKSLPIKISKDNTITIKKVKSSYSEKELKDKLWEIRKFYQSNKDLPYRHVRPLFNKWIEENL